MKAAAITISRVRQCVPTMLPPSGEWLGTLPQSQRCVLDRFLSEPTECVYQDKFARPASEKELFPKDFMIRSENGGPAYPVFEEDRKFGAKLPTLSECQEHLLFNRFNYARYRIYRVLRQYAGKPCPVKIAQQLLRWGTIALDVRAQLVQWNIPLVLSMAKRSRLPGIDFTELVSEGNLALIRSVEKFDVSRGFKFSTYACRAILKSFSRLAMKIGKHRALFPVEVDVHLERSDYLEHRRVYVEESCVEEVKNILTQNLAQLNDMEQAVIRERFALGTLVAGERAKTLEQVGALVGVTKERVRQIQNRALEKIRVALEGGYLAA